MSRLLRNYKKVIENRIALVETNQLLWTLLVFEGFTALHVFLLLEFVALYLKNLNLIQGSLVVAEILVARRSKL